MNRPTKSVRASKRRALPRLSKSKRRTVADLRDLILLERSARQRCFVPIPRAKSKQEETNKSSESDNLAALKNVRNGITETLAWNHGCVALSESGLRGDAPATRTVIVVVDQRLAMCFGSRSKTKAVLAAEVAAFIAWRALAQGAHVGALIFNDRKVDWLWPNCARVSVMLILHAVLNQNHVLSHNGRTAFNSQMLNRALRRIERLTTKDSGIFLITDGSGYDGETRQLLASISQQSQLHFVLVCDPRQKSFSKARGVVPGRSKSNSGSRAPWPGGLEITRLSTWESVVEQLRKASRKSILPPQKRPTELRRDRVEKGSTIRDDFSETKTKVHPTHLNGSASINTESFRARAL